MEALLKNESVEEVFRQELGNALNRLFINELDSFLEYDRYDPPMVQFRGLQEWLLPEGRDLAECKTRQCL